MAGSFNIDFRITEEMVRDFASLTGDMSLLHHKEDFARRSIYRAKVVHGMLTLSFVAAVVPTELRRSTFPRSLKARFTAPVYAGEELKMNFTESNGTTRSYEFSVRKAISDETVLRATLELGHCHEDYSRDKSTERRGSFLLAPLTMRESVIEELSCGDTDSLAFVVNADNVTNLADILKKGLLDRKTSGDLSHTDTFIVNLAPFVLLSTSVGMLIPGKFATFLAFEASMHSCVQSGTAYTLYGRVSHVSHSTRMIKKEVTARDERGGKIIDGRLHVMVNRAPVTMPSVEELKEKALDPGLKGKVALVTGASRGIGEVVAKFLAVHGMKVVINYFRGRSDAERIRKEIIDAGGDAVAIGADVSNPDDVNTMFKEAVVRYGTVDVLVNNAVRDFRGSDFMHLDWDDIQKDIDVVLKGAFNCCREAIELMLSSGGGRIINIGTVAIDTPPREQTKYVIAKSALLGLTRSLAVEYASKNITVNMVSPNFVETDLTSHIPEAYRKRLGEDNPMKRKATAVDVARAVTFLASDYASYTTGQKIMVTGGGPPYL